VTAEEFIARFGGDTTAAGGGEPTVPGASGPASSDSAAQVAKAFAGGSGHMFAVTEAEAGADDSGAVRGDTCHIDVVDRWGNMIAATPSGGWLQSSPAIPGLGFCLGTRLQMTWLDEASGQPLTPGARPRTTLSPTLILKDGKPVIALGTPGGDQQDQWQLLLVLRLLVGGYEPQQAIDAPALHTTSMVGSFWPRTWNPAGVMVEDRLGDDVIAGLEARGHRVTRAGDWALGRLSCVTRDAETGLLTAGANPRGAQGYAAGR
jgi:gamma-glutamyltranspeptidase/glutathione hydrolase